MPTVVDAQNLLKNGKKLPCEAFFVDTNIVIDYKDPFGKTSFDQQMARRNETITALVDRLKSGGVVGHSSISVAQEYFKYVQVGFYKLYVSKDMQESRQTMFDIDDFKKRRDSDLEFTNQWDLQVKLFRKTFQRTFPMYGNPVEMTDLVGGFRGSSVDFGDHTLYHIAMKANTPWVFSNDKDFLAFDSLQYLITTSRTICEEARAKGFEVI